MKILVVDDEELLVKGIRFNLQNEGYDVITGCNGAEAVMFCKNESPDLVILDVMMPEMDGMTACRKIREFSDVPVILLTAKNDLDDKIIGLEHGADNYISKPFHMTELRYMIENLLKNRQRIRGKFSGAYQEDKIKEIELESDNEILMKRVMKVINDNLDNTELKVEMLAMEVGLSRVQLHRKMKEITGISTGEFIRNIRLKKAADLLSEKKVNVSQVAYMVGFSSHTHFSTVFKKFYGVSPTEYINKE